MQTPNNSAPAVAFGGFENGNEPAFPLQLLAQFKEFPPAQFADFARWRFRQAG
ncbi:MAG: hypothetical protein AAB676_12065 [Verrucomicrobiota bacterium]